MLSLAVFLVLFMLYQLTSANQNRIPIDLENIDRLQIVEELYRSSVASNLREMSLAFSTDSNIVGFIDSPAPWTNGAIHFFNTRTFERVNVVDEKQLNGTSLHFTSEWLLVGTETGELQRYDLDTGELLSLTIVGKGGDIVDIATSADEHYIATVSTSELRGENIFYLSKFEGELILEIPTGRVGRGFSVTFLPSKNRVALAVAEDNNQSVAVSTVQLRDITKGTLIATCDSYQNSVAYTDNLIVTPDSKSIIYKADDGIRIWDMRNCAEFPDAWSLLIPASDTVAILNLVVHPTQPILVVSYSSGMEMQGSLQIWNLETGSLIHEITDYGDGIYNAITSLAFSPDGTLLASGGTDGTVRLWGVVGE